MVEVYCDEILTFSKTREEHLVHVRMVLDTLRHHKLYPKASTCPGQFGRSCVSGLTDKASLQQQQQQRHVHHQQARWLNLLAECQSRYRVVQIPDHCVLRRDGPCDNYPGLLLPLCPHRSRHRVSPTRHTPARLARLPPLCRVGGGARRRGDLAPLPRAPRRVPWAGIPRS